MTRTQRALWIALLAATLLSVIRPPFPRELALQHVPTVFMLFALPIAARRWKLSNAAFACIAAFMLFHVLGARYIYSYVPYDQWSEKLFGVNLTQRFGFRRNHYDRVVHFLFGALWLVPVWEIATGVFKVPRRFAYYAAVEFVLAFSMIYELFEWGLSVVLSPHDAGAYNGQQGDIWDAQKDMSCAALGALLALLLWRTAAWLTARTRAPRSRE